MIRVAQRLGCMAVGAAALLSAARGQSPRDASSTNAAETQQVFRAALAEVEPSIVRIDTVGGFPPGSGDADGGFQQADGPTTGVILNPDGWIITSSFNFVRDPLVITVTLHDGRRLIAQLVARDYPCRLALLRVEASGLPAAKLREATGLRAGQWALAAGFGHGSARPAVTVGAVSAVGRFGGLAVQTDAKISPANYGGPLFDLDGGVLGVCVPMGPGEDELAGVEWYDSGIGFAIPGNVLLPRVVRMMTGENLRRGLLGVAIDARLPVIGQADGSDGPPAVGVRILGVAEGTAAADVLRAGDVIVQVHGQRVASAIDFRRALAPLVAGDAVRLTFERDGRTGSGTLRLMTTEELSTATASAPVSRPATASQPATAPAEARPP